MEEIVPVAEDIYLKLKITKKAVPYFNSRVLKYSPSFLFRALGEKPVPGKSGLTLQW